MMAQYLFVFAAISAVFAFAGFGAFFLCFVWLRPKQRKEASKMLTPVEQMALDLASQAVRLDDLRLWLFLEWLQCHCHHLPDQWVDQDGDEIRKYLSCWFETFAPDDLQSEYGLLTSEIGWWRDVDEKTLLRCISKEFAGRDLSR